jgi:hypothetical protein
MVRKLLCAALLGSVLSLFCACQTQAADLFYNHYVGAPAPVPAQIYLSPRATPPLVGHTYITYQPLMPHEFLYRHHRTYYKHYAHGGHTRTHVRWW